MVHPEGFEPPAYWFVANCSIQLSYGCTLCASPGWHRTCLGYQGLHQWRNLKAMPRQPALLHPQSMPELRQHPSTAGQRDAATAGRRVRKVAWRRTRCEWSRHARPDRLCVSRKPHEYSQVQARSFHGVAWRIGRSHQVESHGENTSPKPLASRYRSSMVAWYLFSGESLASSTLPACHRFQLRPVCTDQRSHCRNRHACAAAAEGLRGPLVRSACMGSAMAAGRSRRAGEDRSRHARNQHLPARREPDPHPGDRCARRRLPASCAGP